MINPFTGSPVIEKKLTSDDKELLLNDDKWIFNLASKLNIPGGSGGAPFNLADHTTDELPEGSTNLYSQWEVNTYNTDYLQPKNTTQGLVIGNDLHASIMNSFAGTAAIFNGQVSGASDGINYFANLGYGTGFSGFGGIFVTGRARGTAAAPTQTNAGDFVGGLTSTAYSNAGAWEVSNANHILPGLYFNAANAPTVGNYSPDIFIGGLITRMITFETDTNAIKFNEAQFDSDITFYNDTGTTMTMDGATGLITVGNSISFSSGQGIDWGGTNNDIYANTGTGIVTVRGVNGVNARVGSTDIIATTSTGATVTGLLTTTSDIELGHATDTTLSRNSAGVLAVEGVVVPTISSTNTLTNKRITPRVDTTTSSATPTINTDNVDMYGLTAQTADITSFTTNLSGTPTNGQRLWIYIVGTAARAITWGASFENGPSTLPTTTVGTERLDVGFVWNAVSSKWRCVAAGSA